MRQLGIWMSQNLDVVQIFRRLLVYVYRRIFFEKRRLKKAIRRLNFQVTSIFSPFRRRNFGNLLTLKKNIFEIFDFS